MDRKDSVATTEAETTLAGMSKEQGEVFEHVELKQDRFSIWSVIGIHFSITAAPLAVLTNIGLVTGVGGTSYFFWCYFVAVIGQLLVAASLAEIAAFLPHTSGQVLWAGALAPPKIARFCSYFTGALTTLGWLLGVAGASVYTGTFAVSFGVVVTETYVPEIYHIYILAATTMLFTLLLNTCGVRLLPGINKFMVIFLNAAGFFVFVVLLAKAVPKNTAHDAFLKVVNETGWSSDGFVFLLGFLPGLITMSVPDAASHMAEEIPHPERTVPLVMFATTAMNAVGGMVMVFTLIFCTIRPDNLLTPIAGQPAVQLVSDAWDNQGWLVTVTIILVIMNANAALALLTGGSRLLWAFARTGGLPYSIFFGRTSVKRQLPTIAICVSALISALLALLVFGPVTVLNGIFGCSIVCLNISYCVPIYFMLRKGRKSLPEARHFNLGLAGPIINILSLAWLILTEVTLVLPIYYPVTTSNMNWAIAVFVGLAGAVLANWYVIRKVYEIPKPIYVQSLHGPRMTV